MTDTPPEQHEQKEQQPRQPELSELMRLNAALEDARMRLDKQGVSHYAQEITSVRNRIASLRRQVAEVGSERLHLLELTERVRYLLTRYERAVVDYDRRIESLKQEIRQLGGHTLERPVEPGGHDPKDVAR